MQAHAQIGPVVSLSLHFHVFRLIQCIDDRLLNRLILFIVQRVDRDSLLEYLFETLTGTLCIPFTVTAATDLRHRECDDRKACFITGNILIGNHRCLIGCLCTQLLLSAIQTVCLLLINRLEALLPEGLNHSRPRIGCGLFFILLIGNPQNGSLPVGKRLV